MKIKKILIQLLKISFVLIIFYWLSQKNWISLDALKNGFQNPVYLLVGLLCLMITTFLGAIRWHFLLKAQDIHLNIWRTFQLAWVGLFFNIALPGAVSGDLIKAIYVSKEVTGSRARAMGSILFDRIIGLSALVFVSFFSMLFELEKFTHTPVLKGIKVFVLTLALGVFIFLSYLFMIRENWDPFLISLKKIESKIKWAGSLTRIYQSIRTYHHQKKSVLFVLFISVIIQLLCSYACLNFIYALGGEIPALNSIFVLSPLGLLATAIPLMPGGVGTGHAAFGLLFNQVGYSNGADVFSFFVMIQILIGATGGLVYLRFKSKEAPLDISKEASY